MMTIPDTQAKPATPATRASLITFGSHGSYIDAVSRLVSQANNMNVFTEIKGYTAQSLQGDEYFSNKHGAFINNNMRGFGYWIWKPYIIKQQMDKMEDGDVLFYIDVGCELGIENRDKLIECIDIIGTNKTNKIMATHAAEQIEIKWCKKDLIEKLEMDNEDFLNSIQIQSGIILLLVCPETRRLVKEWYDISFDYHNIYDSPSISKNYDSFVEHRHDQSVFSLLAKKYKLISDNMLLEDVVYIFRNRGGISRLKEWISIYGTSAKKSMLTQF
jgi:hypothetical protein